MTVGFVAWGKAIKMTLSLSDIIQIGAAIAAAAAALFSYKQCKLMSDQLDGDRYLRQNEYSVELARLFANEIVPLSGYITSVVSCSETLKKVADRVPHSDITRFNSDEYSKIMDEMPRETLDKIKAELLSEKSLDKLMAARFQLNLTRPSEAFPIFTPFEPSGAEDCKHKGAETEESEDKENGSEQERRLCPRDEDSARIAYLEFRHVANTLLNRLEHFCMALNAEVADNDVLYPSLHQIFFSIVASLYIFICNANSGNPIDKYYTHVTSLYNKWMMRLNEDERLLKDIELEIHSKYEQKKKERLR